MPLHVSITCAHHQEVKIALHSLWYHHTYSWLTTEINFVVLFRSRTLCAPVFGHSMISPSMTSHYS